MATDPEDQSKEEKSGQSGGFVFNDRIIAGTANFIQGGVENLTVNNQGLSAQDLSKLNDLFRPLQEQVQTLPDPGQKQAEQQMQDLHAELAKGQNANADRLNRIVDGLVELVPGALSALVSMFANPILGGLVGPVTKQILDHLQGSGT